ncbi:hypothetical protein R1flu_010150 [Riccia fluitans]|uniref:Uncharacterized protein n=1 Tax=Riccia fluitans TaxID=41844 RepID=A0ABD1Z4A3_9MARC
MRSSRNYQTWEEENNMSDERQKLPKNFHWNRETEDTARDFVPAFYCPARSIKCVIEEDYHRGANVVEYKNEVGGGPTTDVPEVWFKAPAALPEKWPLRLSAGKQSSAYWSG